MSVSNTPSGTARFVLYTSTAVVLGASLTSARGLIAPSHPATTAAGGPTTTRPDQRPSE